MQPWLIWLILAAVLGVAEAFTFGLLLAPFAIGAAAASVGAAVGLGSVSAFVLFIAVSVGAVIGLRPIARAHRRMPPKIRTGTDALIGRSATVLEPIANDRASGVIRLEGEIWTARAYIDGEQIDVGKQVQVIEIRGATALVSE